MSAASDLVIALMDCHAHVPCIKEIFRSTPFHRSNTTEREAAGIASKLKKEIEENIHGYCYYLIFLYLWFDPFPLVLFGMESVSVTVMLVSVAYPPLKEYPVGRDQ